MKRIKLLNILTLTLVLIWLIGVIKITYKPCKTKTTIEYVYPTQQNNLELTPQNVLYWCGQLDIKFDTIVVAQSILETGWYSSDKCLIDNNIFGLQHSKELSFVYGHWLGSLVRYKLFQDNYYTNGDYYEFLDSCGYAEDSLYTEKLKVIVKQLKFEL